MQVEDWLRSLGLDQHAGKFRDSGIDMDVLSELTDDHLKDLSLPLGHRLKLLRAIRALSADVSSSYQTSAALAKPVQDVGAPQDVAERRHLTVMFADLAGSTRLSSQLDPEALSIVLKAYQNAVVGEIARFGGHVAKFMGDGVLAYFGWPIMHENEAERAIRAGLAIIPAVPIKTASSLNLTFPVSSSNVSSRTRRHGVAGNEINFKVQLGSAVCEITFKIRAAACREATL